MSDENEDNKLLNMVLGSCLVGYLAGGVEYSIFAFVFWVLADLLMTKLFGTGKGN